MTPHRNTEIRSPKTEMEWTEYYLLRFTILRKPLGQVIGSEKNEGDCLGKHFALFLEDKIVAIARLDHVSSNTSQIRFFAVDEEHQGKGFGEKLLKAVELFAQKNKIQQIILQSRENAVHFYQKNGYKVVQKTHVLFEKIQHYLMEKEL